MEVLRTLVLLVFIALKMGESLAAMAAGGCLFLWVATNYELQLEMRRLTVFIPSGYRDSELRFNGITVDHGPIVPEDAASRGLIDAHVVWQCQATQQLVVERAVAERTGPAGEVLGLERRQDLGDVVVHVISRCARLCSPQPSAGAWQAGSLALKLDAGKIPIYVQERRKPWWRSSDTHQRRRWRSTARWGPHPELQGLAWCRGLLRVICSCPERCCWAPPGPHVVLLFATKIKAGQSFATCGMHPLRVPHAVDSTVLAYHLMTRAIQDQVSTLLAPFHFGWHPLILVQPSVLLSTATTRQLLLWCLLGDSVFTWVLGLSFFYHRRRYQLHLLVVGVFLLQQLNRLTFHRCYARSVHLGARVFDAPAYTPRRQIRPPLLSRLSCLLFWSHDLDVTWSSFEDLSVIWLL